MKASASLIFKRYPFSTERHGKGLGVLSPGPDEDVPHKRHAEDDGIVVLRVREARGRVAVALGETLDVVVSGVSVLSVVCGDGHGGCEGQS